jgi:hypothetical protein
VSTWLGISYAPNTLIVLAIVFLVLLLLRLSFMLNSLADKAKALAQRVAILEESIDKNEGPDTQGDSQFKGKESDGE